MKNFIFNHQQGMNYSKEQTKFVVWAPSRNNIDLLIYNDYRYIRREKYIMQKNEEGFFEVVVKGDIKNKFYTYLVDNEWEVTDPFTIASSINSKRSAIIDMEDTNPPGFKDHNIPLNPWKEALIYEVHVKDYSADVSSRSGYRGKFLGLIDVESTFKGTRTGLMHLKELGITHIHLMPVYDFLTVDENEEYFFDDDNYNWGYDPELYNAIEGSYSTDPTDPINRIYEFKKMIQLLHEFGFSVVMDVVYNHTYRSKDSNFNILYPGYYYRMKKNNEFWNGSGCGNEFATERKMARKFIIDSLKYYMTEYKIDGFRFDLMALIDKETVYQIVEELREINPEVLIYGEPWYACESGLPVEKMTLPGVQKGKEFSFFNDGFRDALKGDNDGTHIGYIQGHYEYKNRVETGICGSIDFDEYHKGFAEEATESINYFNSHDNLINYDKLKRTMEIKWLDSAAKMLGNIIYMSLGIPFIHAGNEFQRSKNFEHNSYNLALNINGIDWGKKHENQDYFNYYKELIRFRKDHKVFNLNDPKEIRDRLHFFDKLPLDLIGYSLKSSEGFLIIFHNVAKNIVEISYNQIKEHFEFYKLGDFSNITLIFDESGNVFESLKDIEIMELGPLSSVVYHVK